jgi:hypothetical protein
MTPELLFSVLNLMAIGAWLPLLFLPKARWATAIVPVAMPCLLGVIHVLLVAASLPWGEGGFASLAAVAALFRNPGRSSPAGPTTWPSTCSSAGGKSATHSGGAFHTSSSYPPWS